MSAEQQAALFDFAMLALHIGLFVVGYFIGRSSRSKRNYD